MGCFIGLLARDVLGWWLLGLCIIDNIEVTGNLEVNDKGKANTNKKLVKHKY